MTSTDMREKLRKALAAKRAEVTRNQGRIQPSVAEPETGVRIKYVRCTKCGEMESYQAFAFYNGALPTFCKCQPGTEELVTFWLEVTE